MTERFRSRRRRLLLGAAALAFLLPTLSVLHADLAGAASTFTVAGGSTADLVLQPGTTTTTSYTILNEGDQPATFRTRITGLHFRDTAPQFTGEPSSGLEVTAEPAQVVLGAHRDQLVTVSLRVRPGTPAGGQYAGVVFEQVPDQPSAAGASIVAGQARPLIGRVPGPVTDTGRIVSLSPERSPSPAGPVTFLLRFEDTGNIHYPLGGTMTVSAQGRPVGSVDVPKQLMLPGETRAVPLTWAGPAAPGRIDAQVALTWGVDGEHDGSARSSMVVTAAAPADRSGRASAGSVIRLDRSHPTSLLLEGMAALLLLLVLLLLLAQWWRQRDDERARPANPA